MSIVIIEGTPPEPTDPAPTVIISYQGPVGKTGPVGAPGADSTVPGPAGPNTVTTATTTDITGILKGNGATVAAAVAGTDFEAPIVPGTTGQYWRGDKTWQSLPSGVTNLSVTGQTSTGLTIASDTGTDAAIPQATGSLAGLQSAADKAKEDTLQNLVTGVNYSDGMDIGAIAAETMTITGGAGTITSFASAPPGTRRTLLLTVSMIFTHNATSLIMMKSGNTTCIAGSNISFISLGAGNWRCEDISMPPVDIVNKTSTPTSLAIAANTFSTNVGGASYTIPRADATHAGIISAAEWTVLAATSNTNTGDQSLSLGTVGASTVAVNLSGGTSATVPAATSSAAGVATAAQIAKLDGIAAGAEVNVNADWNAVSGDAQILNKPTLGTSAALNVPASGDAASGEVVKGSDTRLTNARTPTAHTHPVSDLTAGSAVLGDVLTFNGTNYAPASPSNGSPTRSIKVATSDGQSVFTGFDNAYLDGLQEWTLWGTSLPPTKITATDGTTATLDAAFAAEVMIGDELRCLSWGDSYAVPTYASNAANLDASNDYFRTTWDADLAMTADFSLSAWIKPSSTAGNIYIWGQYAGGPYSFATIDIGHSNISVYNSSASPSQVTLAIPGGALTNNVWHHIVITRTSGVLNVYKDSTVGTPSAAWNFTFNITIDVDLGNSPGFSEYNAHGMAMWSMHNRALSGAEVIELYSAGTPKAWADMSAGLKTGCKAFYELANWSGHTSQELVEQSGNCPNLTNNGSIPFTSTGLSVG